MRTVALVIGSELVGGDSRSVEVRSPATGEIIAQVEQGTRKDVGRAVEAAWQAQGQLAQLTPFARASMCHRVADILQQRKEEIARDIALEQGKPYRLEALPEVETAAEMFR